MTKRRQTSLKSRAPEGFASPLELVPDTETEQSAAVETKVNTAAVLKWRGVYALVPVILALATSANTLLNQFASDDLEQVLSNPFIKHLGNLPAAFTTSVWSFTAADIIFTVDPYFRPIFSSLLTINYALFGTTAWGWHLVNILIHAAVTLLVFVVSREVTERNWVSGLTATLFAVHPAHAESVAWVSGVTDPLMALVLLPAFFFYLRFRRKGAWYLIVCSLGFFLVALLSKETALALPVVVAYCELFYFKSESTFTQRLARAARLMSLFAVPITIYFLMRYHAVGALVFGGQPRYPLLSSLLTVPLAILKYLGLMLIPWGYTYGHYADLVETAGSKMFLSSIVMLAAISIAVARLKSKELTLGAVWFVVMLAPALAAMRQFEPAYLLEERYLYVPSIGVCLAIALGLEWIAARDWLGSRGRVVAAGLAMLLVVVWGAVFVRQNRVWDDTLTVSKNSVAVNPRQALAHALLARSYYDSGRPREAETEARAALDLDSRCANAYLDLSYFARMSGKLDKACEYLEDGISTVPEGTMTRSDLATMYLNLGLLYGQRKMIETGEEKFSRSIAISPRPAAWYYTGQFYFDQGRFEEALAMFEQTVTRVPRWFAPIHLRLGLTYEALKDSPRAEMEFEKYLELAAADSPDRDAVKKHLTAMRGGPPSK